MVCFGVVLGWMTDWNSETRLVWRIPQSRLLYIGDPIPPAVARLDNSGPALVKEVVARPPYAPPRQLGHRNNSLIKNLLGLNIVALKALCKLKGVPFERVMTWQSIKDDEVRVSTLMDKYLGKGKGKGKSSHRSGGPRASGETIPNRAHLRADERGFRPRSWSDAPSSRQSGIIIVVSSRTRSGTAVVPAKPIPGRL
jgi:hypothetical protein